MTVLMKPHRTSLATDQMQNIIENLNMYVQPSTDIVFKRTVSKQTINHK